MPKADRFAPLAPPAPPRPAPFLRAGAAPQTLDDAAFWSGAALAAADACARESHLIGTLWRCVGGRN